jgi:hypothetical protein
LCSEFPTKRAETASATTRTIIRTVGDDGSARTSDRAGRAVTVCGFMAVE